MNSHTPIETQVISAEVGNLIDRMRVAIEANEMDRKHARMNLFYVGACFKELRRITPEKTASKIIDEYFPEHHRSLIYRADNYADAIFHAAKGKLAYVGQLKQGELLLHDKPLSEQAQAALIGELDQASKGKGVMEMIRDWRKKTTPRPEPMDALRKEQERQKNIVALFETAVAALDSVLDLKPAEFVLGGRELRAAVAGRCVRFGKLNSRLKAFQPKVPTQS